MAGQMSATRTLLKPRPRLVTNGGDPGGEQLLREAIEARTLVTAVYNLGAVKLAPYVLYARAGALFIDALTIDRDGRTPREAKLGAFRLPGLGDVRRTSEPFDASLAIAFDEERYRAGILATVRPFLQNGERSGFLSPRT